MTYDRPGMDMGGRLTVAWVALYLAIPLSRPLPAVRSDRFDWH